MNHLDNNVSAQNNLLKLLESGDIHNIELGLQLIPKGSFPDFLRTPLYFLAIFHRNTDVNRQTLKVLKPQLSSLLLGEVKNLQNQKKRNSFKFYLEKNLTITFRMLEYFREVDVSDLANYTLKVANKGLGYCLLRETSDTAKLLERQLQKKNQNYTKEVFQLRLNDLGLEEIPKGLMEFQQIEKLELYLNGNPIQKVPEVLKDLNNISFIGYDNDLLSKGVISQMEQFFPVAMAQNYVLQSSRFFRGQDIKTAITHAKKALTLNPKNILALNMLGNCYVEMENDYARALGYYDQALKLNPTHIESWANKSHSFLQLKQYDHILLTIPTIEDLFQLENYDKTKKSTGIHFIKLFNTFALAHLRLGNKNIALRMLERALKIDTNNEETYFNQAIIYASLNKGTAMFQSLEKVADLNPEMLLHIGKHNDFKIYWSNQQFQQLVLSLKIQLMNRI